MKAIKKLSVTLFAAFILFSFDAQQFVLATETNTETDIKTVTETKETKDTKTTKDTTNKDDTTKTNDIQKTTETKEELIKEAKNKLQELTKNANEIIEKFNQVELTEYIKDLEKAANDATESLKKDKYKEVSEVEQFISKITEEIDKIGNVNTFINKTILVSNKNQIFNVQDEIYCSFQYKLPMEAIVNTKDGKIQTVNLYIDASPVEIDKIKFSQTTPGIITVILDEEYIKSLEIASHTLTLYPFGNKDIEIVANFVTRQVTKYETMRVGGQAEFVPLGVTEDNVKEWKQKEKTWSTSNEEIVAIDENGIATAKKQGQAEIRANYHDGTYDSWTVTVESYNGVFATEEFGEFSEKSLEDEKQEINWINVKKSGIDFVVLRYARINDKEYVYDEYNGGLAEVLNKAQEQGIKTGIMFNSSALTKKEAEEEANVLIENLKSLNKYIDLPIGYNVMLYSYDSNRKLIAPEIFKEEKDFTDTEKLKQATPICTEIVTSFTDKMKQAGYDTMIYFSQYPAEVLDIKALRDKGIGLMYYYCDTNDYSTTPLINGTETPDVWFYAGDKYVEGITNENGRTWMLMGDNDYIDASIKQVEPEKEAEPSVIDNTIEVSEQISTNAQGTKNPATGDKIIEYLMIIILSVLGLYSVYRCKK